MRTPHLYWISICMGVCIHTWAIAAEHAPLRPRVGEASLFQMKVVGATRGMLDFARAADCAPEPPNEQSFDVGLLEFQDSGAYRHKDQLRGILNCIQGAGKVNKNGVVVVLLIHGWRHNSAWDDEHFSEFRQILGRLSLRESERYGYDNSMNPKSLGRRVFGIFVGWPGGNWATFDKSHKRAKRIGEGVFKEGLAQIVRTSRATSTNSVVLFIGHSLGAMMLEMAAGAQLSPLAIEKMDPLLEPSKERCTETQGLSQTNTLPDLFILLAPASEAAQSQSVINKLANVKRKVVCIQPEFSAPLILYLTSERDLATGFWFWVGSYGKTAGNTEHMITYNLKLEGNYQCPPFNTVSRGQSWHCLRKPDVEGMTVSKIVIDLPQSQDPTNYCHWRYSATLKHSETAAYWILRVPIDVIDGHSDIFNARSGFMIMGVAQLAGATMSIFDSYEKMFEPDSQQTC